MNLRAKAAEKRKTHPTWGQSGPAKSEKGSTAVKKPLK